MSKVLTVALREFRQTVMRKVFLFAIIGIPIAIVGIMAIAVLIFVSHEEPPLVGTVALVDSSGRIATAAAIEFSPDKINRDQQEEIEVQLEAQTKPPTDLSDMDRASPMAGGFKRGDVRITLEHLTADGQAAIDSLRQRVRDGLLLAAAIIPADVFKAPAPQAEDPPRFTLLVKQDLDSDHTSLIERRIGQSIVRVRAEEAGLDPDQALAMLQRPESSTARVMESGQDASESETLREMKRMIPMVFMMLMWIATFTAGQHLLMSTIEEKSNRVMEVLLSAVSPLQLMTGKILGMGGVGLLIVLIYSSAALAGLLIAERFDLIDTMDLVYLAVYFFMAYFMVASLMAAVGSAVSEIREANTLMTPVMLILMVPLMLWMPITHDPNGGIATAFSFIPPAIPFAMIIRVAADEPLPAWQIPVSIVWGYICVLAMIWMAAKVFRVGVLMYGKPPSPLELLRWLRYS